MIPLRDNIRLERFPLVTVALVVINVVAYLVSIRHAPNLLSAIWNGPPASLPLHDAAIPYEFSHPGQYCHLFTSTGGAQGIGCGPGPRSPGQLPFWATALTSMFLHGGFLHIAGNMLFLAIFGPSVEDSMSRPRYLGLYLVGGLIALGTQIAASPSSLAPTLGASGAIAAVLGAYLVEYRRARVFTMVFIIFFFSIIELPAVIVLGFWFVEQVYFAAADLSDPVGSAGGVAYFAHIGGFLFGMLVIRRLLLHRRRPSPGPVLY
jgi:membrane associated rhomboid family serine protease